MAIFKKFCRFLLLFCELSSKNSIINLPESLVKRLDQGIFSIYRYLSKTITVSVKKNAVKAAIDILLKSNAKKLSEI